MTPALCSYLEHKAGVLLYKPEIISLLILIFFRQNKTTGYTKRDAKAYSDSNSGHAI